MKTFITILITAIVVAILAIGGTYYFLNQKCIKEKKSLEAALELRKNPATNTESAETLRRAALESSRTIVSGFLNAKKQGNFDYAKPYMTTNLISQFTQESFAGTSSTIGRFEVTNSEYLELADLYRITVRVYQNLNGAETGYSDNTYNVVKEGNQFLLNEIKEGIFVAK